MYRTITRHVDLGKRPSCDVTEETYLFQGDAGALMWEVVVTEYGSARDMAGMTIEATAERADGELIDLTASIEDNTVTVMIPEAACAVPGQVRFVMKAEGNGDVITLDHFYTYVRAYNG